jgi:hypothetical protein
MRYRNRDSGVEVDVADETVMDGGVWEPADDAGSQPSEDEAPPKSGRGSARQAWADYATSVGVEVDDDWTRDDIITAVEEG